MPVSVRIPTVMRPNTGGESKVEVVGGTVGSVVDELVERYPGLSTHLRAADGGLHKFVNVYVNDEDIRYLDKLETKLAEGDEIAILPAVAGGA